MENSDRPTVRQRHLARHLFLSEAGISKLIQAGVIQKQPRGQYNLDEGREAYIKHLRRIAGSAGPGGASARGSTDLRRRRAEAETQLKELKLVQAKGMLIPVGIIQSFLERSFNTLRQRLVTIAPKLAPMVRPDDPATAQALITIAINDALAELSAPAFWDRD